MSEGPLRVGHESGFVALAPDFLRDGERVPPSGRPYDKQGYFILDTSIPGNRNTGHEFSNGTGSGVIGPALSPAERNAIIEFLKTI